MSTWTRFWCVEQNAGNQLTMAAALGLDGGRMPWGTDSSRSRHAAGHYRGLPAEAPLLPRVSPQSLACLQVPKQNRPSPYKNTRWIRFIGSFSPWTRIQIDSNYISKRFCHKSFKKVSSEFHFCYGHEIWVTWLREELTTTLWAMITAYWSARCHQPRRRATNRCSTSVWNAVQPRSTSTFSATWTSSPCSSPAPNPNLSEGKGLHSSSQRNRLKSGEKHRVALLET